MSVTNQQLVNMIMLNDVKFHDRRCCTIDRVLPWVACTAGATGNLTWYSVPNISDNATSAIKCWLNGDSLYQNLLMLNLDFWSYLTMQ